VTLRRFICSRINKSEPEIAAGRVKMNSINSLKTLALLFSVSFSSSTLAYQYYKAPYDIEFNTGVGNTQGTLAWSIAGGSNGPNILSELTYKDVQFKQLHMSSLMRIHRGILAKSEIFVDYRSGVATDGTVQDSDYNGDNRTSEYSRSYSSAADSSMSDFSLGYARRYPLSTFQVLKPMVGYSHKQQNMIMTDGAQMVDTQNPQNVGPFRNTLNSSYDTQWDGVWVGLSWGVETRHHQLGLSVKHYWLDFHSEADWNLRSDFAHPKSFEQSAVGTGVGIGINYAYQFSDLISLWLNWYQEDWNTDAGQDTVFFADGSIGRTRLNEVSWKASGLSTGLELRF
jgi:hypothetical protein